MFYGYRKARKHGVNNLRDDFQAFLSHKSQNSPNYPYVWFITIALTKFVPNGQTFWSNLFHNQN